MNGPLYCTLCNVCTHCTVYTLCNVCSQCNICTQCKSVHSVTTVHSAHSFQLSILQEYTEYHSLHQRSVHYNIVQCIVQYHTELPCNVNPCTTVQLSASHGKVQDNFFFNPGGVSSKHKMEIIWNVHFWNVGKFGRVETPD